MSIEKTIRLTAGSMVLASILLSHYVDERWLLLTALVGINLVLSATVNWCPLEWVLKRCGVNDTCAIKK